MPLAQTGSRLELPVQTGSRLERLPLVTLYLTERCNSRCVTCNYWRHGRADLTAESVARLLPSLSRLQTRVALISGGEPLLNPQWAAIAEMLQSQGMRLWLLTSGLSLAKHAVRVSKLFDAVTVSLDGCDRETYAAIRGLDAFEKVCEGIAAAADEGTPVSVRVTVQRANFRQLPSLVDLARRMGARQVSFLAVDVANPHAFGRNDGSRFRLALDPEDLPELARILRAMERTCAADFRSGFIAESPRNLWRIHQYFGAVCGAAAYPPVRCNAPEFSAVISPTGQVNPCFFIPGPEPDPAGVLWPDDLAGLLNADRMLELRRDIRAGARRECERCVCSLWRDPQTRDVPDFLIRRGADA